MYSSDAVSSTMPVEAGGRDDAGALFAGYTFTRSSQLLEM